jgi:hypothetical protein
VNYNIFMIFVSFFLKRYNMEKHIYNFVINNGVINYENDISIMLCRNNNSQLRDLLIKNGMDFNSISRKKLLPIFIAMSNDNIEYF